MIASESSFKHRTHALPKVIGLCGINLCANPHLLYNPYNDFGNILDSALLLRQYLDTYGTYTLAYKRYKGWSNLGYSQALHVQQIRSSM